MASTTVNDAFRERAADHAAAAADDDEQEEGEESRPPSVLLDPSILVDRNHANNNSTRYIVRANTICSAFFLPSAPLPLSPLARAESK